MELSSFFARQPRAALGFSGGVDSAYLLYAAVKCGAQVQPYYVRTAFQPRFEYEDALRLTRQLGVELKTLTLNPLEDGRIAGNPPDRCYYCKGLIFSAIARAARHDGFGVLLDGTNASDRVEDRPGMKALQELQVLSPLRLCGLTKDEIRRRSRQAGLFTWNKPAYACLATRIPTGTEITPEALERTERCESFLMQLGFSGFRIRLMDGCARLELPPEQLPRLLEHRQAVVEELKKDYTKVLLDLEVRHEQ